MGEKYRPRATRDNTHSMRMQPMVNCAGACVGCEICGLVRAKEEEGAADEGDDAR